MERTPREARRFFYRSEEAARGAWFARWQRALEKTAKNGQLTLPDSEEADRYGRIGWNCISNYWSANINHAKPLQVEKYYQHPLKNGVVLVGKIDQLRAVSLEQIARYRPDLICNGRLVEGYNSVIIVDLKTDYLSYDARTFKENPNLWEEVRWQYTLHEGLQATAYTWLYLQTTGNMPIGFLWYHLRSGKTFFTYRGERDFLRMSGVIDHVLDNLEAQSFPIHVDRHCRRCEYIEPCNEDKAFLISAPEDLPGESSEVRLVPNIVKKDMARQLRLKKFRVQREKRISPRVAPASQSSIILRNLPWDETNEERGEGKLGR